MRVYHFENFINSFSECFSVAFFDATIKPQPSGVFAFLIAYVIGRFIFCIFFLFTTNLH